MSLAGRRRPRYKGRGAGPLVLSAAGGGAARWLWRGRDAWAFPTRARWRTVPSASGASQARPSRGQGVCPPEAERPQGDAGPWEGSTTDPERPRRTWPGLACGVPSSPLAWGLAGTSYFCSQSEVQVLTPRT
ncbi:Hypothetical predicted protein [Marmota monax]|uniref:Uncharacterized protein n=1 Tax=Marmota monax TaxID=9995 RepID=A0A5E4ABG1_MARMO|nr:Hypothetical predicted protein [Marmota monax]